MATGRVRHDVCDALQFAAPWQPAHPASPRLGFLRRGKPGEWGASPQARGPLRSPRRQQGKVRMPCPECSRLNLVLMRESKYLTSSSGIIKSGRGSAWVPVSVLLCSCHRERPAQEPAAGDSRQSQRSTPTHRGDARPQQQPRGQEPGRHRDRETPGSAAPPPPPPHKDREPRSRPDAVPRREGSSDKRPKSSYTDPNTSPQSPRDKRPLSGPNIRTPNLPVTDGVKKTAQQTGRPFNTYPRTESDSPRSPTHQVFISTAPRARNVLSPAVSNPF